MDTATGNVRIVALLVCRDLVRSATGRLNLLDVISGADFTRYPTIFPNVCIFISLTGITAPTSLDLWLEPPFDEDAPSPPTNRGPNTGDNAQRTERAYVGHGSACRRRRVFDPVSRIYVLALRTEAGELIGSTPFTFGP